MKQSKVFEAPYPPPLLSRFPTMRGVYVCSTESWIAYGAREWFFMVESLRALPPTERLVGMDLEWYFQNPTAVLQIASFTHCFVIQISCMTDRLVPPEVADFLTDPSVIKCGNGLIEDGNRLLREQQIRTTSIMDLGPFAVMYGLTKVNCTNLKALTESLVGLSFTKSKNVARSNWEMPLDDKKLHYAEDDAIASLLVGQYIMNYALRIGSLIEHPDKWLIAMGLLASSSYKKAMAAHSKTQREAQKIKNRTSNDNGFSILEKGEGKLDDKECLSVRLLDQQGFYICSISDNKAKRYIRTGYAKINAYGDTQKKVVSEIQFTFDPANKERLCPNRLTYCDMGLHCPYAHFVDDLPSPLLRFRLPMVKCGKACAFCLCIDRVFCHAIVPPCLRKLLPSPLNRPRDEDYVYFCEECLSYVRRISDEKHHFLHATLIEMGKECANVKLIERCATYAKVLLDEKKLVKIPQKRRKEMLEFVEKNWREARLHRWSAQCIPESIDVEKEVVVDNELLRRLTSVSPGDIRLRVLMENLVGEDPEKARNFVDEWRLLFKALLPSLHYYPFDN